MLSAEAQQEFRQEIMLHRETSGRGRTGSSVIDQSKILRLTINPIHAYLYGKTIIVTCNEATVKNAKVSIIDASTGEIIHSELYTDTANICIDLSTEQEGDYYIVIEYNDCKLQGEFRIDNMQ